MKTISNNFKEALKNIKQIDTVISYADHENTNFIITQNSEYLITQAQDFLVTESADVIIDNGGIQNCSIYWNTDIFKSVCKMLNLETSNQIAKGTELNVRIGLLVGENYEYVDYGKFYTTEDSAYQLATGTYTTTAYDKMIRFNIKAIDNPLTFETGTTYTLKQYLEMVCNKCGVQYSFDFTNVANATKQVIDGDPYKDNKDVTYRDIIDDIAESLGTNFIINADNKITNKEIEMTSVMTIDDDILRDTNVYIGEKKDPIDGLQIYDGSTMLNYAGNDSSVLKIKSNNIMSANSDDLMASVLSLITDFTYYAYQLETFGVFAIEPFDCFTVTYNNTNYLLCSFHNDLQITSGVSEEISYEFSDEDSTYEYTTSNSTDKTRDAFIEIDKAKGQVVLKANANGNIVQAELNADASEGSEFNVKADNIKLEGYTTINGTFQIDEQGNMSCSNANITGGKISVGDNASTSNPGMQVNCTNQYHTMQGIYNSNGITLYNDSTNNYSYLRTSAYSGSRNEWGLVHNGTLNSSISAYTNTVDARMQFMFGENHILISTSGGSDEYTARTPYIKVEKDNSTNSSVTHSGMYAPAFVNTSTKKYKTNIKKLDNNGLDIIKNTDLYNYNYVGEDKKGKKHIGVVIDKDYKCSEEIISNNGEGIDLYAMTSVCFKAIQEQQEQIEELKKQIKSLKGDDN